MKLKIRLTGLIALVLAGLSWLAEITFYGGIDPNGVLQDSFFLPLTFILAAIGIVILGISLVLKPRP